MKQNKARSHYKRSVLDAGCNSLLWSLLESIIPTASHLTPFLNEIKELSNIPLNGLKLIWTGMGEFNSDDHYIYYCGQESLRRKGVGIIVSKTVWNPVLGCNIKNDRIISVCLKGKPSNITIIQVYVPTSNAEWAEQFYEDLKDILELTPKKDVLFMMWGGVECKSRKSKDTWSNRWIWPWSEKLKQGKA